MDSFRFWCEGVRSRGSPSYRQLAFFACTDSWVTAIQRGQKTTRSLVRLDDLEAVDKRQGCTRWSPLLRLGRVIALIAPCRSLVVALNHSRSRTARLSHELFCGSSPRVADGPMDQCPSLPCRSFRGLGVCSSGWTRPGQCGVVLYPAAKSSIVRYSSDPHQRRFGCEGGLQRSLR